MTGTDIVYITEIAKMSEKLRQLEVENEALKKEIFLLHHKLQSQGGTMMFSGEPVNN